MFVFTVHVALTSEVVAGWIQDLLRGDELWRAVSMSLLGGFGEEPPAVHPRGAEPLVGNQVVPTEAERHLSIFRQKRGQRLSL